MARAYTSSNKLDMHSLARALEGSAEVSLHQNLNKREGIHYAINVCNCFSSHCHIIDIPDFIPGPDNTCEFCFVFSPRTSRETEPPHANTPARGQKRAPQLINSGPPRAAVLEGKHANRVTATEETTCAGTPHARTWIRRCAARICNRASWERAKLASTCAVITRYTCLRRKRRPTWATFLKPSTPPHPA